MDHIYCDFEQIPLYITIPELSRILRISRASAYQLAHATDSFPVIRIGKRMVVPKDALLAYLEKHTDLC